MVVLHHIEGAIRLVIIIILLVIAPTIVEHDNCHVTVVY